jgi:hypothetical protein
MTSVQRAPNKSPLSRPRILANSRRSGKGKWVLVEENGKFEVRRSKEYNKKNARLDFKYLPSFSPKQHKKALVITYGRDKELFVYRFAHGEEVQWMRSKSFSGRKSYIQDFQKHYQNLQLAVDSGEIAASDSTDESDPKAAVSEADRSEPGSNESKFNTLSEEFAGIARQLIDWASRVEAIKTCPTDNTKEMQLLSGVIGHFGHFMSKLVETNALDRKSVDLSDFEVRLDLGN